MTSSQELSLFLPTLLLLTACGFDLKTGKFPNWLFVGSLAISIAFTLSFSASAWALAFFICLTPLFFAGVVGAGDIKLMGVFCLLTNPMTSLSVLTYSLFWGLLMGLMKLFLSGQLLTFTQSFVLRTPQTQNQKIPYTVAILLGWLTFLSQGGLA
ncbi:hypothetical protein K2X05_04400 [bacterium]|nr:hypothetical protein [bacterium]